MKALNKKKVIGPIILLVIIIAVVCYFALSNDDTYYGEVEAEISPQICLATGEIIKKEVNAGQKVKEGDLIFEIDSKDQQYILEQLELSKDILEDSNASDTDAGKLEIEKIKSQIKQQKDLIKKYEVLASCDGVITSVDYKKGDVVSSSFQLASIADTSERYFVFYLPKELMAEIDYGDKLSIISNDDSYKGTVKYIDVKSLYTPKDFQTQANKNKESHKIKLLLPDNCPLKPGEGAEVRL